VGQDKGRDGEKKMNGCVPTRTGAKERKKKKRKGVCLCKCLLLLHLDLHPPPYYHKEIFE
jgi:hypothetical protein